LWRPATAGTAQVGPGHKTIAEGTLREIADALGIPAAQVTAQVAAQVAAVLDAAASEAMPREDLQAIAGMKHREHFRKAYVDPLVTVEWLQRTIPDKPTSRLQKYRATDKALAWLAEYRQGADTLSAGTKSDTNRDFSIIIGF
jgi:hypothetical protein